MLRSTSQNTRVFRKIALRKCSHHAARAGAEDADLDLVTDSEGLVQPGVLDEATLAGTVEGHRFHYLRGDPHRNIASLPFRYDTTLGFPDAVGFRAGIARPFHPWDFDREQPAEVLEVPLAAMDATLAEERYLGLSAKRAEPQLLRLLDWAAEHGGAFALLWHPDRFDPLTSGGWDRLYSGMLDAVAERGGICVPAAELVSSHST